jgi:hypothetical protein
VLPLVGLQKDVGEVAICGNFFEMFERFDHFFLSSILSKAKDQGSPRDSRAEARFP